MEGGKVRTLGPVNLHNIGEMSSITNKCAQRISFEKCRVLLQELGSHVSRDCWAGMSFCIRAHQACLDLVLD